MHSWLNMQTSILDEMVTLDGPGGRRLDLCSSCSTNQLAPLYRCLECCHLSLHCSVCIVKLHKTLPLHRLEVGSFFSTYNYHLTRISRSTGRMGFLTGPFFIRSVSYATSGTTVTHVQENPDTTTSPSLTSTVVTKFELHSVPATWEHHGISVTGSCLECAGTRPPSPALKPPFPSTFLKPIINSLFKGRSTCMTTILLLCKSRIIKVGQSR